MNKQDMLKIQTCALKVNIHCEGCASKIKKSLKKVEGVYKVIIDSEQGKVMVSGNVDPLMLINKLEKGGKHAELWGPQKGAFPMLNNNQFKNMQFDKLKDAKGQKGGGQIPKQIQQMQMQMNQKKGVEEKFMGKDQKSVKFKVPEESDDEFDEDYDFDDEFDDEDDEDEFDEAFKAPAKGGHGAPAKKAVAKGDFKVKKDGGKDGGKGKKGGGIDVFLKGILGKASGGKKDSGGKNGKKGEKNKKEDGDKGSKKHGGNGKDGGGNSKGAAKNGGGKGKDGWSKKGGDNFDEGPKMGKHHGFNEMNGNQKGGGGGGGRNTDFMGQMGGFPAVQGLPAMNGAGRGQGNPYNPQYMAHMMMMNQQRENGHGSYNPMMMMNQQRENGYGGAYNQMPYARPHPGMGYGPPPPAAGYGPPPPGNDQFTHMFSDENTDSCSIM